MAVRTVVGLLAYVALHSGFGAARYEFQPALDRLVGIDRGDVTMIGTLDIDGGFHEACRVRGSGSGPAYALLNVGERTPTKVYEYRAGVLIPGTMRVGGEFVPAPGGRAVPFAEYRYFLGATPIWNLPGGFSSRSAASWWRGCAPRPRAAATRSARRPPWCCGERPPRRTP